MPTVPFTPPYFLLLLLLLLLVLLFLKTKLGSSKQKKHPPGPPKLPLIGNLHQIGTSPHQSLRQLSEIYGPVIMLHLGRIPCLVVSSAEAAKDVMKTHDLDCCSRPLSAGSRRLSYNYRDIAFAPYGGYWRAMRKICVLELFSMKRVQSFRYIREEAVFSLIDSISEASASATAVDLPKKLYSLMASITFRIAFGKTFRGSAFDHDRFQELIHDAEAIAGNLSAEEFFPHIGWIIDRLRGHHAKVEKVSRELDTFFSQVVDEHLKPERREEPEDIVDVLLRMEMDQTESESGTSWLTKDNIKAVLLNIFLGGVDTGAMTIIWAVTELMGNPRAMRKAQYEVRNSVKAKGRVTEDGIENLQYLKLVVKETLRLHTPVPLLLPRETMSPCTINGYEVHPKMLILVNVWAIARDPRYWKDPEDFVPERFVDSSIDYRGQNFELLPFGSGRRVCPGINMGITTVELALANLLYFHDWKFPEGEEDIKMDEDAGLTVPKKMALRLVPVNYFRKHQSPESNK